jgi:hypothetical protein
LKLRFLSLPPLDKSARLPLLLAGFLLGGLVFQLLAVDEPDLPEAGPVAGAAARHVPVGDPEPAAGAQVILSRSLFAPAAAPGTKEASPLGGIVIAGSVRIGAQVFVIVQGPGTAVTRVTVGGRIGDWRLRAVRKADALLTRNEEQIIVPFGARGVLPTTAAATGSQ